MKREGGGDDPYDNVYTYYRYILVITKLFKNIFILGSSVFLSQLELRFYSSPTRNCFTPNQSIKKQDGGKIRGKNARAQGNSIIHLTILLHLY